MNKIGHGASLTSSSSLILMGANHIYFTLGLHVLDSVFRRVTLDNDKLKSLVRDLQYHEDPQGDAMSILFIAAKYS